MATSPVNFFQPGSDASIDENSIVRQRALAQALMQQGMAPNQGSMVSGHYVAPGALSYMNQLAQVLGGQFIGSQSDQRERELGQRVRAQNASEANAFVQSLNGTPASTKEVPTNPPSPTNPNGNLVEAAPQTTPAVPGDPNRALAMAMQSQNPALQAAGGELLKNQMSAAQIRDGLAAAGIAAPGGAAPGGMPAAGAPGAPGAPGGGSPQMPSGIPAGISPQAFALSLSPNAQLNKIGAMVQDANKPVVLAEGGTALKPNSDGSFSPAYIAPKTEAGINVVPIAGAPGQFQAAPVRGYAQAKADAAGQVAGAEAAARDPYAPQITVNTPSGPRLLTPAQSRQAGGAPAPGQPSPGGMLDGTGQPVGPGVPVKGTFKLGPNGQVDVAAAQAAIDSIPAGPVRDQAARALSQQIGTSPAAPPGAPGIALQTDEAAAYGKERATSYAKAAENYQNNGQTAASTLRNLDELKTLYADPNVAKGALAEKISGLKNIAASFNVDMSGLSSEQAAAALTNKMALSLRSTADGGGMPGSMSDADRTFLKSLTPDLTKSPEGRARIIDAMQKVASRQVEVARMANQYEQQNGQIGIGFDKALQDYSAKNQLFTQPTPGGGTKQINDLLNKYR